MPNSHQLRDHQKQETNPGIFFQSVSNNNGNSRVYLTVTNKHTGTVIGILCHIMGMRKWLKFDGRG